MRLFSNAAKAARAAALSAMLAALVTMLSGCSEYLDRRDSITLNAGDAVMTDRVTQMVDPWPRESADHNIAYNGEVMEAAFTRYRTGNVIPPRSIGTSESYNQSQNSGQSQNNGNAAPVGPTVTQSAAPVK